MSHSNPGSSPTPASSQQASSQALLDELRVAADRARDERLKLARLFKHSAELPVNSAVPAASANASLSAPQLSALTQQVERLERIVAEKLTALDESQQEIENRTQYLESLRHTITDTTRAFVTQVEQAQHFKAHVDAAKQHVRMSAGKVVEDVRQHLAEYEQPIADRIKQLTELDDQIDKRIARMQQMHKQAGEAVDKHLLAALRSAKEQAADLAAPIKKELDAHLQTQRDAIEKTIHAKIEELDVDVEVALKPLTGRFDQIVSDAEARATALAEAMPAKLEAQVKKQMDTLRTTVAKQAESIVTGLDEDTLKEAEAIMNERVTKTLDGFLAQAEEEAGGYVAGLIDKLNEARERAIKQYEQAAHEIEFNSSAEREQALRKIDAEVLRLDAQATERIQQAQKVIEEAVDGIHRRATAAVDSALRVSQKRMDEYEVEAVAHMQTIDDGIENSLEQSNKRIADHEKWARKQGDLAVRTVESGIGAAQQRLASFEAGIAQRIGLATRSADEAAASIDNRLEHLERDAATRVSRIVDLAETSGKQIADSLTELSTNAQQAAEKAQQDLEAKLGAFEDISAEALQHAEETLRQNVGELRDASRAMIDMVTKQVRAQASDIEPQTREVIAHAEQTLRRRVGELREGAQSMVDLAVSRLEGQLDEVKRKAQHAAFQGVHPEPEDSDPPKANDAA